MPSYLVAAADGSPDATRAWKRNTTDAVVDDVARSGLLAVEAAKHALTEYLDNINVEKHPDVDGDPTDSSVEPEQSSPYPDPWGIPNAYHIFYLFQGGLPEWRRARAIATAKDYYAQQKSNLLGYQTNCNLNYEEEFGSYLNTHVNNVGDPFQEGNFTVNSKFMERAVLDYYAELWHAKWPHSDTDLESYWGFILTMGSTEGNLYGMWNARDYLSGKKILVDPDSWTSKHGKRVKVRYYPIIVCFNYGTTFKGAYDDVALACDKLKPILLQYSLLERKVSWQDDSGTKQEDIMTGYWFHIDGALGAAYMPYIKMAHHGGLVDKKGPIFYFRLPMVHSISMSGHKWIGVPAPCGLYMTKTKYQMSPRDIPEYMGTPDTTFAGSRNGLSAILLWDNIARHSYDDQIRKSLYLENMAIYTESSLRNLQDEVLKEDLYVARTPLALTLRFKRKKYSLSNEDVEGKRYSHVFMMEHVTTELVDAMVEDLSKEGAFPDEDTARRRAPTSNGISTRGRG